MKKKIEATIIADSISPQGKRITTYLLTYPRFIHAELMTHRLFSRNSASSRAIPFEKMLKMVEEDPFIPIAVQKDHKGMQGSTYLDQTMYDCFKMEWLSARDSAIKHAKWLNVESFTTKQLCNRILEPYMWHTILLTATEYENFFELRCPKYQTPVSRTVEPQRSWKDLLAVHGNPANEKLITDNKDNWSFKMQYSLSSAEIHIQALAEAMWDAMNESTPKELKAGEWHIPFRDRIDIEKLANINPNGKDFIKVATARCARLSYMTFDGEIDYIKDIQLHDRLLADGHASPFEHVCRVLTNEEYESCGKIIPLENGTFEFQKGWVDNFRGYKSYRRILNFS